MRPRSEGPPLPITHAPIAVGATEAARLLGISRSALLQLAAAGHMPRPIRLGRRKLWAVDDLRRWIAAGAPPREQWEAMQQMREVRT